MYRSGKTNGKADVSTRIPNSVFTDRNNERLKPQNRALLLPGHFESYSANLNLISRTHATSGMRNQEPIISQELNLNLTIMSVSEGKMVKGECRDIDSDLKNPSED